jgi:hypothetical protein
MILNMLNTWQGRHCWRKSYWIYDDTGHVNSHNKHSPSIPENLDDNAERTMNMYMNILNMHTTMPIIYMMKCICWTWWTCTRCSVKICLHFLIQHMNACVLRVLRMMKFLGKKPKYPFSWPWPMRKFRPLHFQSTTASWDSLLSSLGGRGENNMEHGLENILLKPQEEQIKRQFAILSVFNDSPSSWALWGSRPLKTYRDM